MKGAQYTGHGAIPRTQLGYNVAMLYESERQEVIEKWEGKSKLKALLDQSLHELDEMSLLPHCPDRALNILSELISVLHYESASAEEDKLGAVQAGRSMINNGLVPVLLRILLMSFHFPDESQRQKCGSTTQTESKCKGHVLTAFMKLLLLPMEGKELAEHLVTNHDFMDFLLTKVILTGKDDLCDEAHDILATLGVQLTVVSLGSFSFLQDIIECINEEMVERFAEAFCFHVGHGYRGELRCPPHLQHVLDTNQKIMLSITEFIPQILGNAHPDPDNYTLPIFYFRFLRTCLLGKHQEKMKEQLVDSSPVSLISVLSKWLQYLMNYTVYIEKEGEGDDEEREEVENFCAEMSLFIRDFCLDSYYKYFLLTSNELELLNQKREEKGKSAITITSGCHMEGYGPISYINTILNKYKSAKFYYICRWLNIAVEKGFKSDDLGEVWNIKHISVSV